jgi:hypothetical protein
VIVGELEVLKKDAEELNIQINGQSEKAISLLQLLGLDSSDSSSHKKTGFLKIRTNEFEEVTCKLCILDGVVAYKAYEESQEATGATTMILVIESSRMDDQIYDAVNAWKSHAMQLDENDDLSVELPAGVECSIFST